MNLSNLITESQRLAGRVDPLFNDRTRRWLNEAQTEWAISVPWPQILRTETFVLDGTAQIVLPPRVLTVKWIMDRTNSRPIFPNERLDREMPESIVAASAGAITYWKDLGIVPVARQPSATGTVQLFTTASDSFNVYVAGLVENTTASGTPEQYYPVQETIVVGDTNTHTSVNNYTRIEVLGKDTFTNGDVVVKDAAGNQLSRIPRYVYQSSYRLLTYALVPDVGTLLDVHYIQRPAPLVDNAQLPPPGVDIEFLINYAASRIHAAQPGQQDQANAKMAIAAGIIERRAAKERTHGDKDWRGAPEPLYWCNEDQYETPYNVPYYGGP
jgi:hypothetical protein